MTSQPEQGERIPATADAMLIDELQRLLVRQLELARGGSFAGLDELCEQADAVVARIAEAGLMDSPALLVRKTLLAGLYRELYTVLAAQRQETVTTLHMVRRGKRMIAAYRRNL
jgi:hypothetical protein